MPIFYYSRKSDGKIESIFAEMPARKSQVDVIPSRAEQDKVDEQDFCANAANLPIHAVIEDDGKILPLDFKNFRIRSLFATAIRVPLMRFIMGAFSEAYLQTVCGLQFLLILELHGTVEYLPDEVGDLVHLSHHKPGKPVSLSISAEQASRGSFLPEMEQFSPPPHLKELRLRGGLFELPNWLASIENLTNLEDLVEWTEIVNGAFPSLRTLQFYNCLNLRFLPEGLENISSIRELRLWPSHGDLARRLGGEENYKIKHIPKFRTCCPVPGGILAILVS
ncbi:hypothetical protein GH714_009316 [Hevea brasiliensis]|uniref:Uncharacterized protein n=1 Tax=Hevea brasiliensis TaxID=3981 RepID=A0A6A6LIN9_HEVBR|nr:hypothetical protein GH714_009316 [Hevea brasiliensis]